MIIKQLANIISFSRILGVGVIFWLTPYHSNFILLTTLCIYTIICVSDFLDGWIARKLEIVSTVGKVLDPLADKILVLVFLPLLEMQVITSFPVFIILTREFTIMALRIISARDGDTLVAANTSGKLKTAITLPVCGILLARVPVERVPIPKFFEPLEWLRLWVVSWPSWFVWVLIYLVVFVTIWSFFDYFRAFIWDQYLRHHKGDETRAKMSLKSWVPNTITLCNLSFGIAAAILAWHESFVLSALLIIICNLIDAVDGFVARKLQAQSNLGAFLDSKADFVSFGIATALLVFKTVQSLSYPSWLAGGLALLYYLSVHYRLRRFDKSGHQDMFEGLPSPIGALIVTVSSVSLYLGQPKIFLGIVIISSLLMISKVPYMHTQMARQFKFFRFLQYPTAIFIFLSMLQLLNISPARFIFAYEVLFALVSIYVLSPIFHSYLKKQK